MGKKVGRPPISHEDRERWQKLKYEHGGNLAELLKEACDKKKYSVDDISNIFRNKYQIQKGSKAVKNILDDPMSARVLDMILLCKILDIVPFDISGQVENCFTKTTDGFQRIGSVNLVTDYENEAFIPYQGEFYTYMLSTKEKENTYFEGKLTIREENKKCVADFILYVDKEKKKHKIYSGICMYAPINHTLYILLAGCDEICFLNIRYKQFRRYRGTEQLFCRLAYVMTTEVDEYSPTVHKMFLCRDDLKDKQLQVVLNHLKLTDGDIYVKKDRLEKIKEEYTKEEWNEYSRYICEETMYMVRQNSLAGKGNVFSPQVVELIGKLKEASDSCYKTIKTNATDDDILFGYLWPDRNN